MSDTLTAPGDAASDDAKKKPSVAPKAAAPTTAPPVDYDRLSNALGLGGLQATLAADRAKVDSMEPGPPTLTPPPKQPPPTDPFQAFGQPAMWLAALGGLLTRQPLTASIQAAGAVMESVHKQDDAAAQRAFTEWKINSENAMKMVKYEQDAYKAALAKYSTDARAGEAEIRTLASAFKNAALQQVYDTEGMDGVKRYLKKSGGDASLLSERSLVLQQHMQDAIDRGEARRAWDDAHPNATPVEKSAAHLLIDKGQSPEGERATAWTILTDPGTNQQYRSRTGPTGKPEYTDMSGNTIEPPKGAQHIGAEPKAPGAGSEADTELKARKDVAKEHPDWSEGQVATAAHARVKLAASPFMQNLNQKEAAAAQKAIDADPTILNDPNRMGNLVNQVTGRAGQKETLTGQQIAQIDDHSTRVSHLLDDLQRMRELLDNPGIASKLGRPLRAGEAIGNILGAMSDTDRAEYDNLLARVRQEGPRLMSAKILPNETRPSEEEAGALFPSQRWGDTKQAVDHIFEDWQNRFVSDLRVYNAQKLASTGQGLLILGGGTKPAGASGKVIKYDTQGNPIP